MRWVSARVHVLASGVRAAATYDCLETRLVGVDDERQLGHELIDVIHATEGVKRLRGWVRVDDLLQQRHGVQRHGRHARVEAARGGLVEGKVILERQTIRDLRDGVCSAIQALSEAIEVVLRRRGAGCGGCGGSGRRRSRSGHDLVVRADYS